MTEYSVNELNVGERTLKYLKPVKFANFIIMTILSSIENIWKHSYIGYVQLPSSQLQQKQCAYYDYYGNLEVALWTRTWLTNLF